MADLYISEFSGLGTVNFAVSPAPLVPPLRVQKVAFTTSAQSAALLPETSVVLVSASAKAHLAFGANPTATTNDMQVPADTPMFFCMAGPGQKIAAVVAA
jgi:hypothetical protein